jgi:uncharacterized membrane protein YeiH
MEQFFRSLSQSFRQEGAFELPAFFTLLAYFTFGVTGALAGLRRGYDVIGVVFLATITAGGGGLIRDGLLISSGPASILTDGPSLLVVLLAAVLTYLFEPHVDRLSRAIAVIDSLGLGAFAVVGVQHSLEAGLSAPASILGGTLTAVGGGLLRDILVREEPLLFKPGQFYALVAIGGSALFEGLVRWEIMSPNRAALVTILAVFAFRMLAIRFNWRTTALYRKPPPAES